MHDQLLKVLTREGVLVKVSISYWRGCKKLKAEDIGLKADDVSDRLVSLGHKRLLPKEALSQLALVESRAHAYVESNTFPFLNGLAHFVPNARFQNHGRVRELGWRIRWVKRGTGGRIAPKNRAKDRLALRRLLGQSRHH